MRTRDAGDTARRPGIVCGGGGRENGCAAAAVDGSRRSTRRGPAHSDILGWARCARERTCPGCWGYPRRHSRRCARPWPPQRDSVSLVPVLLSLAAMKQLTVRLAFAIALASSFDVFTTRGAAAPQDAAEPRTPVVSRPGSPAPIVGGIRPPVLGSSGGVSAGHPLTSTAALEILLKGGNAFDAGVASVLVGGVIEQDLYSLGGESLILVYPVKDAKVTSIVGQGWAPKGATLEYVPDAQQETGGGRSQPGRHSRRARRRPHGAREMGHDELRAGGGARHRLRRGRVPAAATHPRHDSAQSRVLQVVARQPEVLVEAGRLDVPPRRNDQAAHPRRYVEEDGRGRAQGQEEGARGGDRRGARPVLQGRHRRSDGGLPAEARRAVREERLRRVLRQGRGADVHHLQGLHRLQAELRQPGPVAAADAEHPRKLRPARDGAQQPGLHPHADRGDEARRTPTATPTTRIRIS